MQADSLPLYKGNLHSYKKGVGLGLAMWEKTELEFVKQEGKVLRYIFDNSENGWTKRHLPDLISYLNSKNVTTEEKGKGSLGTKDFWIFLFSYSN